MLRDALDRPLGSLRISVTDRCNLRCRYCMPEAAYEWLPAASILSFEELTRLARLFVEQGVSKLRITGGEPLLRPDLDTLTKSLGGIPGVRDLALTTNGTRLAKHAAALRTAGLQRITVSLDTLRPERMRAMARFDRIESVHAGIGAAIAAGFERLKLNTVVIRGQNDDELADIVRFAAGRGIEPRFIEYMDVGGATDWSMSQVVPGEEIVERLRTAFGGATPLRRIDDPHAPAERWQLGNGVTIGIVTSTTAPFCRDCDRARLTADGKWFKCLYADAGIDLATPMRAGATDAELAAIISDGWRSRTDRGAESRHAMGQREALVKIGRDRWNEMHVRGG